MFTHVRHDVFMEDVLSLPFSGKKLRRCRERAGFTRPGLAERCRELGESISPQHIARLERDEHLPKPSTLRGLATGLGLTIDDLLDEDSVLA